MSEMTPVTEDILAKAATEMNKLVGVPVERRDVEWEYRFLDALPLQRLKLLSAEPQLGPDGWPYMMVETGEGASEPAPNILKWLAQRGIGLAVNPNKEYPDFVFNYGMIWFFREKGLFVQPGDKVTPGAVEFQEGQGVLAGAPTAEYLPDYVRMILREFFRDQGLHAVKIAVVSTDKKNYDLAFSVQSLGNPPAAEHKGIAEAVSWFLPGHYSVLLVSEHGIPGFSEL